MSARLLSGLGFFLWRGWADTARCGRVRLLVLGVAHARDLLLDLLREPVGVSCVWVFPVRADTHTHIPTRTTLTPASNHELVPDHKFAAVGELGEGAKLLLNWFKISVKHHVICDLCVGPSPNQVSRSNPNKNHT